MDSFSPSQVDSIVDSTARINVWVGAVRAGKTVGSSLRWCEYTKTGPDGPLAMIGKTERTLRRNVIDPLTLLLGDGPSGVRGRFGDGIVEIGRRPVYLVGANDARSETKIRGMTLAGAYGDEVTTWPDGFFPMLLTRLSIDGAKFFGTTNPEGPFHPLKQDYLDRADELDLVQFRMTLEDNPFLSDEYKKQVIAEMKAAGPMFYQRYILGLWVAAEGAIYGLQPDGPNVVDRVPDGVQILDGLFCVDYGTTNPTVFLYLGLGSDDRIYVLDEWRHDPERELRKLTDSEFADAFREWRTGFPYWDGVPVIVDPSAASFITQLHRDGIPGVRKANNAVVSGIRLVSTLLGAERLVIVGPNCPDLVREMASYVWDPKATQRGTDAPLKKDDHGPDALRYGLMRSRSWWRTWVTFSSDDGDGDSSDE